MKNNIIHIAYCTDSNYLEHVSVSIQSIILNNLNEKLQFHVFLYNAKKDDIERLKETSKSIVTYEIKQTDLDRYRHKFTTNHINKSTFIRLMVPRLLSDNVEKLLYLDADVLCFSNISAISDIYIDNFVCAVGLDSIKEETNANSSRLKLTSNDYFNAGVLYINIPNWIKLNIEEKTNEILFKNNSLKYADQDALNITLQNHIKIIDSKWNYLFTWMTEQQKEEFFYNKENLPYFVHFTGPRKMWYEEHNGLAQDLYNFYKHFTPWANNSLKSYKNKMRTVDFRVYATQCFKKGSIIKGFKFYSTYLLKKFFCN
ncbi:MULTISPECIES: glycosyltransferase family 8 protein [unclassified Gilliamella]|uniref:glycosyltransferase family 8 protein n=1 Tax=unclassified Gilliamella TaxID=2685620 RepID=UPI00080E0475|nr:glycosyltransferase family 8 protein [Gilliamella apicola]OCG36236.1 glycosyl transferase family 8 [Gilliamella apicola]OCG52783.1 glycosyl transferase family 8 [Gilliamella apicola]